MSKDEIPRIIGRCQNLSFFIFLVFKWNLDFVLGWPRLMPALIPVPEYPFSIPDRFRSLKANVNPEIVKLVLQHPHYSLPKIEERETWYTPEVDDISLTNRDKRTALSVLCMGSGSLTKIQN